MAFLDETGLKLFLQKCDGRYLRLATGGTVSGTVTVTRLAAKSDGQNVTTNVTSNTWGNGIYLVDKNSCRTGCLETYQGANSTTFYTAMGASVQKTSGGYTSMTIGAYANMDGSASGYTVTSPAKFRTAIGVKSGSSVPSSDGAGTIFIQV